jgi:hypothetical protein
MTGPRVWPSYRLPCSALACRTNCPPLGAVTGVAIETLQPNSYGERAFPRPIHSAASRRNCSSHRSTLQKVDHGHAFRTTVMIAAAAGALSEMVGERLTCRASISMPRPIRYKMEKNWAQLGRGEVRRRHQGPNRSQRRKSIWAFDRAHSTDLQKPARPIHRLSRTGCRWPYRKSTRRGAHIPKALNSTAEQHDLLRRNHPFRARMTTAIDLSLSARVRSSD